MTKKQYDRDRHETNKLIKRLRRQAGSAIADFNMIEDGDHVMVCMSGGKDSYAMLDILIMLRQAAPVDFKITAVHMDQKFPQHPIQVMHDYFQSIDVDYRIVEQDTYSLIQRIIPEGQTPCSICSRLRRGILYRTAGEIGATKVALGHTREDIIETMFLNMFYGGTVKGMPPKLLSDDGNHIVIRPMAYCGEKDIVKLAEARNYPILPKNLCGVIPNHQRQIIKQMLFDWQKTHPGRVESIFRAMKNVVPSHMMDESLYDFKGLESEGTRQAVISGDADVAVQDDAKVGKSLADEKFGD